MHITHITSCIFHRRQSKAQWVDQRCSGCSLDGPSGQSTQEHVFFKTIQSFLRARPDNARESETFFLFFFFLASERISTSDKTHNKVNVTRTGQSCFSVKRNSCHMRLDSDLGRSRFHKWLIPVLRGWRENVNERWRWGDCDACWYWKRVKEKPEFESRSLLLWAPWRNSRNSSAACTLPVVQVLVKWEVWKNRVPEVSLFLIESAGWGWTDLSYWAVPVF